MFPKQRVGVACEDSSQCCQYGVLLVLATLLSQTALSPGTIMQYNLNKSILRQKTHTFLSRSVSNICLLEKNMNSRHPTYPNPTITEAVCDIHFRLPQEKEWKPSLPGELFKHIQNEYPEMEPVLEMGLQF
jgi:hypothetical protein